MTQEIPLTYYSGFVDNIYYSTPVGAYDDSESPYGTYDQNGNVWEWNEALVDDQYRGLLGGAWASYAVDLSASFRGYGSPLGEGYHLGLRVAGSSLQTVPEPARIGLILLALSGLFFKKRR